MAVIVIVVVIAIIIVVHSSNSNNDSSLGQPNDAGHVSGPAQAARDDSESDDGPC